MQRDDARFRPPELDGGVMVRGKVYLWQSVVSLVLILPQRQEAKAGRALLIEATLEARN